MSRKILLVEDEKTTAEFLTGCLSQEGFVVDHAHNGRDGLYLACDRSYAAIILDRMMPQMDGLAVLSALRSARVETPVLLLSALGTADDRIEGLTAGADDYLVKPFAFAELLARIRILIRRGSGAGQQETELSCADLTMNLLSREVTRSGHKIELQPREFKLLEYFLRHQGEIVTRAMLLESVWDYHFDPGTNVIDVHISRLRRKMDDGFDRKLLQTVRGAGYLLKSAL